MLEVSHYKNINNNSAIDNNNSGTRSRTQLCQMEARLARNRAFARTQPFLFRRMTGSCVVPRATNCGKPKD